MRLFVSSFTLYLKQFFLPFNSIHSNPFLCFCFPYHLYQKYFYLIFLQVIQERAGRSGLVERVLSGMLLPVLIDLVYLHTLLLFCNARLFHLRHTFLKNQHIASNFSDWHKRVYLYQSGRIVVSGFSLYSYFVIIIV